MSKKFFGSKSILQRQFIASGLTGVFALSAVGSSYAGAMYYMDIDPENHHVPMEEGKGPIGKCISDFFKKHKVAAWSIVAIVVIVVLVAILVPILIIPKLKETNKEEQKEQGDTGTQEQSDSDSEKEDKDKEQEEVKDQESSDGQGEKGKGSVDKRLVAGVAIAGTSVVGAGAVATSKLLGKSKGNEAATTEKLGNEDDVPALSDAETDAETDTESKDEGKKNDDLKENDVKEDGTDVENKGSGEVGE